MQALLQTFTLAQAHSAKMRDDLIFHNLNHLVGLEKNLEANN